MRPLRPDDGAFRTDCSHKWADTRVFHGLVLSGVGKTYYLHVY
jgi:hypothetical protein